MTGNIALIVDDEPDIRELLEITLQRMGIEFVSYIQSKHPEIPVAVITAHGNIETAIQALKSGAFDFVTKPVDLTSLRVLVQDALKLSSSKYISNRELIG